ncbi:MAG: glycine zipper domain-containing protein [Prevotella sp.]|nr:glycine zipper domain-containing protein [Prevotella sp.]
MNKGIIIAVSAVLLSGCGSYTSTGAYTGSTLGSILGSAIGGLSDGPRGSDLGTIIGMASGAVIGAAIGNAADQQRQADLDQYRYDKARRAAERASRTRARDNDNSHVGQVPQDDNYDSGFDETNSGDDRLYDFNGSDYTGNYSAQQPTAHEPMTSSVEDLAQGYKYEPTIEIRNARFVDSNQDNMISRGELCKVIFEVINRGEKTLYDVQPTVIEANGNRHLYISPGMHVEKILPGKGIRYTAVVKADNRLKDGTAKICVSVVQGNKAISKVNEFNIPTRR